MPRTGEREPEAPAAAGQSGRSLDAGQGPVRPRHPPEFGAPHIYGFYAKGCYSGGEALALDGPHWQVMRPSRNRMYGLPVMVDFLERLSEKATRVGWPGLLVGDMAQPRGGPMITGHASHQIGIDADVWLTPMPDHRMSRAEREETSATDMVRSDRLDIDPDVWTPNHLQLIKLTAEQPEVERIFVNAAIKKALCRESGGGAGYRRSARCTGTIITTISA